MLHAWTLRYWADSKQRERSFKDGVRSGRTVYGSGRKLAQDAQLKLTVDKRAGDKTFADYVQAGKASALPQTTRKQAQETAPCPWWTSAIWISWIPRGDDQGNGVAIYPRA